jgi:hypothetical protein
MVTFSVKKIPGQLSRPYVTRDRERARARVSRDMDVILFCIAYFWSRDSSVGIVTVGWTTEEWCSVRTVSGLHPVGAGFRFFGDKQDGAWSFDRPSPPSHHLYATTA